MGERLSCFVEEEEGRDAVDAGVALMIRGTLDWNGTSVGFCHQ